MFKNLRKKFTKDKDSKDKDKDGKNGDKPSESKTPPPVVDKAQASATSAKTPNGAAVKPEAKKKPVRKERTLKSNAFPNLLPDMPDYTKDDLLKSQTTFQAASQADRPMLFVKKLRLCSIVFDFDTAFDENGNPRPEDKEEARAKEVKRQLLLELSDYLGKTRSFLTEPIIVEILKMISINLFRSLPARHTVTMKPHLAGGGPVADPEEEEPAFDPAWPHLHIIYELFLRFIISNDVDMKILKKHVTGLYVLHILELFDSEDPRERDYLKTILHRIYAKFMSLRAFIRKAINNAFYTFIYETESHNGVAELLEILGSIINGFALPLKQEHKTFLRRVLIPMHKVRSLGTFHQQLSYCVSQFVNKDAELAVPVILGLVKLWPKTNSAKEVLFLSELEEILELTQPAEFKSVMVPLFQQLARTIGSPHFQVAERALFMWHNEYIASLVADHRDVILPIIYPVLHENSQHHWNPTVNNLTVNVLKIFMEMDSELVQECTKKHAEKQKKKEVDKKLRAEAWSRLSEVAQKVQTEQHIPPPVIPNHAQTAPPREMDGV